MDGGRDLGLREARLRIASFVSSTEKPRLRGLSAPNSDSRSTVSASTTMRPSASSRNATRSPGFTPRRSRIR
jgi:hypothetical protein